MINILSTLRFNIKAFGLVKGLRLPVFILGKIKVKSIGNIIIKCPIQRGLIMIGVNHKTVLAPYSLFYNTGTIEVYGKVRFNYGMTFLNSGTVVFRGHDLIGKQCYFDIRQRLEVGHDVSIGYECHITDSDNHYVVDVNTHQVHRNAAPVSLGNFNWFGSNSFIKKGTITPDYLIVASPFSMLSKDYSSLPPYTVMAGCPARSVKQGIRRIYNYGEEDKITKFFQHHPEEDCYQLDKDLDLDEFCRLL